MRLTEWCLQFTQIPWVDEIWNKNALATKLKGATGVSILGIVGKFVSQRQEESKAGKIDGTADRDMLSLFMEIQKNNQLPPWYVPCLLQNSYLP